MANLGPQFIKNSYQDLVQITASNALAKGDGTSISNISVTASWAQNASDAINAQTASFLSGAFLQGGNSFGATALLGTNDTQDLQFETSGSVRMTISSSGRVGIGTTTPSTTLQVAGTSSLQHIIFDTNNIYDIGTSAVRARNIWSNGNVVGTTGFFSSAVMYNSARIGGEHTATALLHISGSDSAQMMRINSPTNANILFVSGSGNVGIGTTTPGLTLDVAGDIRASSGMFNSTTQTQRVRINSTTHLAFQNTGSVEVARFDNAGNWGIGTTSPSARLHTSGANALRMQNTGFDTFEWFFSAGTGITLRNVTDGTNPFFVGGTDNVGISTTNPLRRLHVDASGSSNTNVPLLLTSVDTNNRVGILFASSSLSAGRQHYLYHRVSTPTVDWVLDTSAGENATWNFLPIDDTNYTIQLRAPVNGGTARITTGLSQSLFSLGAGGTAAQHLNISSSGRVGVGTTTPRELLHVAGGNIALDGTRYIDWGSGNSRITDLGLTTGQGYPITISTFGPIAAGAPNSLTEKLRLTGSGSLGLGTTNPLSRFHISGSDGNEFLRVTSGSQNILNVRSGSAVFFAGTGVGPTANFDLDIQGTGTANGGSVRFAANGSEWRFGSVSSVNRGATGNSDMFNVTMGGTSPTAIQNPMSITFNANQNATSGSGYTVLRINATHATTAGTGSKLLQTWEFGGVQRSVVNITGSIGVGITAPSASVHISSSLGLAPILAITPHHPLPTTNIPTGSFMVSSSIPPKPFFWDGTTWNALY